jgi:hypothetical protein
MAFCLHTNNVSKKGRFERNTIEVHFVGYLRSCHYAKDTHIVSDYLQLLLSSHSFVMSVGHKSCTELCMRTAGGTTCLENEYMQCQLLPLSPVIRPVTNDA